MAESPANDIPIVDLSKLGEASVQKELVRGFADFGLVYLREHGIDQDELKAFYGDFCDVLARDAEEKATWSGKDVWYQRGWTPPNTEQAVVAGGQPDFKECYFICPTELDEEAKTFHPEIYAENIWPENADAFRESYLALGKQAHDIGMNVLEGIAAAFNLPAGMFRKFCEKGPHVSRALRYLPLDESQVGTDILWGEEHTDFNLLTLLPGGQFFSPEGQICDKPDPKSGLYLRARASEHYPNGRVVAGRAPAGCMVAQVGQQLEIVTGGRLLATPHVITPPSQPGFTRTAFAHFIHSHTASTLFPFEGFRDEQSLKAYGPPVLAGSYDLKTLVDISLAPKEALSKLGYHHYDRLAGQRLAESIED